MRQKLLLADDSVTIQRVIELTFADEDVQVVAVGDGKKAIAAIEQDRPDIVLADVGMPERDGYEVAAFIKGNPQLAGIPVLLLTGAFEPIDETRARAVGCDGVLVKPFEPQMVINRVKDLLAGRRPAGLWTASPMAQGPTRHSPPADSSRRVAAAPPAPAGSGGSLEDYFDRLDAAFANLDASPEAAPPAAVTPSREVEAPQTDESVRVPIPTHESPQPWRREPAPSASPAARSSTGLPPDVLDGWDPDLTGDPKRVDPLGAPSPAFGARVDVAARQPPAPPVAAPAAAPPRATPIPFAAPIAPAPAAPPPAEPAASTPAPVLTASAAQPPPSLAEAFAALLSAEQSRLISPSAFGAPGLSERAIEDIVRRVVGRMGEQAVRDTVVDVAERLVREEIERIKGGAHDR